MPGGPAAGDGAEVRPPRLHVIDFEGHPRYGVVEYGVVTLEAQGIVAVETALCAATGEIPPADTRVHGIDQALAANRAPFADCYGRFVELRRTGLFCAHNAIVEHGLLKATWAFPPYVPDWSRPGTEVADWGPWLDTLHLARAQEGPGGNGCSLEALTYGGPLREEVEALAAEYCASPRNRPHCALFDALATALWLQRCVGVSEALDWFARVSAGSAQSELF